MEDGKRGQMNVGCYITAKSKLGALVEVSRLSRCFLDFFTKNIAVIIILSSWSLPGSHDLFPTTTMKEETARTQMLQVAIQWLSMKRFISASSHELISGWMSFTIVANLVSL